MTHMYMSMCRLSACCRAGRRAIAPQLRASRVALALLRGRLCARQAAHAAALVIVGLDDGRGVAERRRVAEGRGRVDGGERAHADRVLEWALDGEARQPLLECLLQLDLGQPIVSLSLHEARAVGEIVPPEARRRLPPHLVRLLLSRARDLRLGKLGPRVPADRAVQLALGVVARLAAALLDGIGQPSGHALARRLDVRLHVATALELPRQVAQQRRAARDGP
mmetsp:Transcript_18995/g.51487  ORF Transcript_18995/g.51487 Transcript_18995/m.51487 type:complete len:223 (+) Transcript_18995:230-898(+)